MGNGLNQIDAFKLNVTLDSLLLKSIQLKQASFNEYDFKKLIMISKMWMLAKCQKLLIVKFETIRLTLAFQEMLSLFVESWKLRFKMNQNNSIIEEDQLQIRAYMQATLKLTRSRIQTMRFLGTMSMLVELNLIK